MKQMQRLLEAFVVLTLKIKSGSTGRKLFTQDDSVCPPFLFWVPEAETASPPSEGRWSSPALTVVFQFKKL